MRPWGGHYGKTTESIPGLSPDSAQHPPEGTRQLHKCLELKVDQVTSLGGGTASCGK